MVKGMEPDRGEPRFKTVGVYLRTKGIQNIFPHLLIDSNHESNLLRIEQGSGKNSWKEHQQTIEKQQEIPTIHAKKCIIQYKTIFPVAKTLRR
jgi:hypothetical protein